MSYCPLQIWPLKTCNPDISKFIIPKDLSQCDNSAHFVYKNNKIK